MADLDPTREKISVIMKDLDLSSQFFHRSATHLATLQGWALTLVLAYLAFLATVRAHSALFLVPLVIVLFFFMFLEARLRRDLHSALDDMRQVEEIFMEPDAAELTSRVKQYVFRGVREKKWPTPLKYLGSPKVIAWYLSLFLLACGGYIGINRFPTEIPRLATPCK